MADTSYVYTTLQGAQFVVYASDDDAQKAALQKTQETNNPYHVEVLTQGTDWATRRVGPIVVEGYPEWSNECQDDSYSSQKMADECAALKSVLDGTKFTTREQVTPHDWQFSVGNFDYFSAGNFDFGLTYNEKNYVVENEVESKK